MKDFAIIYSIWDSRYLSIGHRANCLDVANSPEKARDRAAELGYKSVIVKSFLMWIKGKGWNVVKREIIF